MEVMTNKISVITNKIPGILFRTHLRNDLLRNRFSNEYVGHAQPITTGHAYEKKIKIGLVPEMFFCFAFVIQLNKSYIMRFVSTCNCFC